MTKAKTPSGELSHRLPANFRKAIESDAVVKSLWPEMSGFAGSLQPRRMTPGNAVSMLASIRCAEECAGHAVGLAARTGDPCVHEHIA